ncbi:DUF4360 domain-containing protein [Actinomadura sp. 9N215]|uniref:DUF4360 domain-containing protein n=1 Tax=Actinomadura sp. 9N215 TaxID=3375150 RepID=UPI003793BA57
MMNTGRAVLAAIGATIALPALTSPAAVADPPPKGIIIEIVTVNGAGCPAGTVAVALSEDFSAFTITRSGMRAEAGGVSNPADARKACQVAMKIHVPQGHTYAIRAVEYNGTAHLEPGATGIMTTSAYLQGMPKPQPRTKTLKGPFSGPWRLVIPDEDPIYSPCGEQRNFNISTELRVDPGTSDPSKPSYMDMDGKEVYEFAWKRCPIT